MIDMPKIKTHRGAAKRFKITGSGKIVSSKAGKSHILTKKSAKRKRILGSVAEISAVNYPRVRRLLAKYKEGVENMTRIKRCVIKRTKHREVLKAAKGYYGSHSRSYRLAKEAVLKSLSYNYIDRKIKKRTFRSLLIVRINAAARLNGISYNEFINGLKLANIDINRKMLSEIALSDPAAFAKLTELAKNPVSA